jgi:hypothetical protein
MALGMMPSLQAVPVVHGVDPDVGSQTDCADAATGMMLAPTSIAPRTTRPSFENIMEPPPHE